MMTRSHTTDRELFLILISLFLLALATHFSPTGDADVEIELATHVAASQPAPAALDAAANPYWAPAHAFPRRPAPVYSDATPQAMRNATQE
ncbi:MAG TPA: hypothetical protein GX400_13735 [Chloroflexi bacterium]|nr:hypothetical protein [Chloroflexota bacterium]